jgi:hypothetical protein
VNAQIEHLDGIVSQSLSNERKTGEELRTLITTLNGALGLGVEPDDQEQLARDIEERFGISMGLGSTMGISGRGYRKPRPRSNPFIGGAIGSSCSKMAFRRML